MNTNNSVKVINWYETAKTYLDRRLIFIFILGCSSGFPWALIGSNLSGWLKDVGMKRGDIALMGIVFTVYAINFMWAPLLDRVKIPLFNRILGQRKSWIVLMQLLIIIGALSIAFINPQTNLLLTGIVALMIAFASATKDVGVDGYRIDTMYGENDKLPPAACVAIIGWWSGYSLPGALGFLNADSIGWNNVYVLLAVIQIIILIFTIFIPEPKSTRDKLQKQAEENYQNYIPIEKQSIFSRIIIWLSVTIVEPFVEFFRRNGWQIALLILGFVFLFKIGEAFLGRMSIVFYKEIGFSNAEIAEYSKLIGWAATVVFTIIGSAINIRYGIVRGLIIGGIAMAASNLMFAAIAMVGPNTNWFLATIIVDNFTTAFSTVAFVSFLTVLSGRAFSATQYALLASLGNFGRTTLATLSGDMVDYLEKFSETLSFANYPESQPYWAIFFIITSIMVIPSLLILFGLGKKLKIHIDQSLENA